MHFLKTEMLQTEIQLAKYPEASEFLRFYAIFVRRRGM